MFVVSELPDRIEDTNQVLFTPNVDFEEARFEEHEKMSYLEMDYSKIYFQYSYEGKRCRAYRYKGVTQISILNKVNMEASVENTISFSSVLRATKVDLESLFDTRFQYCNTILHFLMCFPTSTTRTRRTVLRPYIVVLSQEKMDCPVDTGAPLKSEVYDALVHRDNIHEPLGLHVGKILEPAEVSLTEAKQLLSGIDGQQLIVRNRETKNVMGRIWNTEAFHASAFKRIAIDCKGITVECFRRSSEKKRAILLADNNLPFLMNIPYRTLETFAAENPPNLRCSEGPLSDEVHTNWDLLSSVAHVYLPVMQTRIAEYALLIQNEIVSLRQLCMNFRLLGQDKFHAFDREDFVFERVLDFVRMIYSFQDFRTLKMKETTPILYNLMCPDSKDKAVTKSTFPIEFEFDDANDNSDIVTPTSRHSPNLTMK